MSAALHHREALLLTLLEVHLPGRASLEYDGQCETCGALPANTGRDAFNECHRLVRTTNYDVPCVGLFADLLAFLAAHWTSTRF